MNFATFYFLSTTSVIFTISIHFIKAQLDGIEDCRKPFDIVFLVDKPESIEIRDIIKNVLDNMWNNSSRLSIITYGCTKIDALIAFTIPMNNQCGTNEIIEKLSCKKVTHKNHNRVNDAFDLLGQIPTIKGLKRVIIVINKSDPPSDMILRKYNDIKSNAEVVIFTSMESSRIPFHSVVNEDDLVSVFDSIEHLISLLNHFKFVICRSIDLKFPVIVNEKKITVPLDIYILFKISDRSNDLNQIVMNKWQIIMQNGWKNGLDIKFTVAFYEERAQKLCFILIKEAGKDKDVLDKFSSLTCSKETSSIASFSDAIKEVALLINNNNDKQYLILVVNYIPHENTNKEIIGNLSTAATTFINLQWKINKYNNNNIDKNVNNLNVRNALEYSENVMKLLNNYYSG